MAAPKMLILYFSGSGNTEKMANMIAEGARPLSIEVTVGKAEKFDASLLPNFDALVLGSPTYFSNMAWQVKKIVDESIVHYKGGKLRGKVGGVFTSSGTARDGKDCVKMLEVALGFHHKMRVIEGIVRATGDSEKETENKCREYGKKLAEEMSKGA